MDAELPVWFGDSTWVYVADKKKDTRIVDIDPAKAYYTFSVSDRGKLLMLDFILLNLRPDSIYSSLFNL